MRHPGSDERLLALKLAATAERRATELPVIRQLARKVDYDWLADGLARGRLLPLLGSRLVDAAPQYVPGPFRDALRAALVQARRRSTLVERLGRLATERIEAAGIRVVPVKGPHLAERLYGDIALRSSNDIDLLVPPDDFQDAVRVLGRHGYHSAAHAPWIRDLPLFEASLRHADEWRPPIDLHWRLHCGETAFSREYLLQSDVDETGIRVPRPADELAALLLFWSRDGLAGLRHAADVGACWDRHSAHLAPGALDTLVDNHPELRGPVTAAVMLAERAVGVPTGGLLSHPDRDKVPIRLALRIANLVEQSASVQFEAGAIAVDGLLRPRGELAAFLRQHFFLPPPVIKHLYGLPSRSPWASVELRRIHYAASRGLRLAPAVVPLARAAMGLRTVARPTSQWRDGRR
jgi:hypothetical protein